MTVCKKEVRDFSRSRFFILLFIFLGIVMALSVAVAAADYRTKLADYNQYLSAIQASGASPSLTQPQLFPLQLMRGSIEYLELLGALFAVIIGYGMIAKEKHRGTLQLLFSRPLGTYSLAWGKIIALAVLWLLAVVGIFAITTIAIITIGNATLHPIDFLRLGIATMLAWAYLLLWSAVGMGLASMHKRLSTALIVGLVLWLVVVLIVPQIGDTMDPDNQVPGGLFKSLQVDKAHEKAVIAKFNGYESTRNFLETTSIAKHYERPSFAYLGIKDEFNQKPIAYVWHKTYSYSLWLLGGLAASISFAVLSSTKRKLLRKES